MADAVTPSGAVAWTPPAASAPATTAAAPRNLSWHRALPVIGPVLLFLVWDLVVRAGWIKPILLPPPAPFKLFVLLAGVAEVRPLQFVTAIGIARGARYLALGYLAVRYGALAIEIMSTRGRDVALTLAGILVAAAALFWISRRRRSA